MSELPQVGQPRPFVLSPGPHVHSAFSTPVIMWWVNFTLLPATAWGAFVFGPKVLGVVVATVVGALGAEWLGTRLMRRRPTLHDGSAFCTGLLLALTLPPLVPLWTAALGGAFAILLGKMIFGGLGFNLFNPALIGRAFMMATFPLAMTTGWAAPRPWFRAPLDALTTATPLTMLKERDVEAAMRLVTAPGHSWLPLLFGFRPGSIGEISIVLVAVGGAVLVARGIIRLTIPVSVFAGVALVTVFTGATILHLVCGGLWLGAFYMATDYVTSPNTRGGQIAFGLTIGVLTAVIRLWGGFPEGICYAILIGNALVPAFDLWFRPRRVAMAGSPS